MIILGIETSCDETAISIIKSEKVGEENIVKVLANNVLSQIELHKQYGGVFPMMAKREHQKNLLPLLEQTLKEAGFSDETRDTQHEASEKLQAPSSKLQAILVKEPELLEQFTKVIPTLEKPKIDYIAVTKGPGLEPALWVGINFALALSEYWQIPIIPVNHMEGHILVAKLQEYEAQDTQHETLNQKSTSYKLQATSFPALSLLVSGGHTQLVLMENTGNFKVIGETRDDAVGEAFDKVARILGLPYPGGPQISKLANEARKENLKFEIPFPRPMLHSKDFDFSFSGLKTHVLYLVQKLPELTLDLKKMIAREFEDTAVDVLISKTGKAIDEFGAQTLILGGGVTANKLLRENMKKLAEEKNIEIFLPEINNSTDNALMISIASIFHTNRAKIGEKIIADGNWSIAE